jgi:hypothetical protein
VKGGNVLLSPCLVGRWHFIAERWLDNYYNIPEVKHFICTLTVIVKLRMESKSSNFLEFKSNSKLKSVFEFPFKIRCDLVQVTNMKVASNALIYLLQKLHIFWRDLAIFSYLSPFLS